MRRTFFLFAALVAAFSFPPILTSFQVLPETRIAGQDSEPAAAGKLVLTVQDTCEVGELVRMSTEGSDVDNVTWRIIPSTDDFEVIDGRAFFSAREPGEFLVIVAAAKGGKAFVEHRTIVAEGGYVAPPGEKSLSAKVSQWAREIPEEERNSDRCLAVANVFREVSKSDDIALDKFLEATALSNSAVLGDSLEKWIPFFESLGDELDAMVEEGELVTREQYQKAWLDIAKGLEKVAPSKLVETLKERKK